MKIELWAPRASRTWLCTFDGQGQETRYELTEREGEYWVGTFDFLRPGTPYGFRAEGPDSSFQPEKLLLDPAATMIEGPLVWNPLLSQDSGEDSAPALPKSLVAGQPQDGLDPASNRPKTPWDQTVILEAHVKGLTKTHPLIPEELRGTYAALAEPALLDYLQELGITALELLPVQAFLDDQYVLGRQLSNYWGYQPLAFSALDPRYAAGQQTGQQADAQFRQAVQALHERGIEVILDVVFNHSGEGDQTGPTISLRGINDAGYYVKNPDSSYANDTGTGNTLAVYRPQVLRLVLDSLRFFAQRYGVDGFRFDLALTLGRTPTGFDPAGPFFQAIAQDPVLRDLKMIAEPWDIGPGGYRLGDFAHPWREWNDTYRDSVRKAWRGDYGSIGSLASALLGTAQKFDHSYRPATSSINFLTAHDGFTLQDVVSYSQKHNEANGEGNRDGHNDNHSDNLGCEGPSTDPQILAARARRVRAMLATLLFSQGVPMLLAGDEQGNSQQGNNNAYCQDNELTWLNWEQADRDLTAYVAELLTLRRRFPQLRQKDFLHGDRVRWWRADGRPVEGADWHDAGFRCFQVQLDDLLVVVNTGDSEELTLPEPDAGRRWQLCFASDRGLAQSVRLYQAV